MSNPVFLQPNLDSIEFFEELKYPLHEEIILGRKKAKKGEVSLENGICFQSFFSDSGNLLQAAYRDFEKFFNAAGIKFRKNGYKIDITEVDDLEYEAYRVFVDKSKCVISSSSADGIRRGLVYLEDEILRAGGVFLKEGFIEKTPFLKTRIGRSALATGKNDLDEGVDFYHENYLNRVAHDGVNALWLPVAFEEIAESRIIPEYGTKRDGQIQKLREIVNRCFLYGIKIFLFCIEPKAFSADDPILRKYPELGGHRSGNRICFCPGSAISKQYLIEAVESIFKEVPLLGGIINITVGERTTICHNGGGIETNNCPRCSKRAPWETLADMLASMREGMQKYNPEAELISWPYNQPLIWGEKQTINAAAHLPEGTVLQHNFESPNHRIQLGKERHICDYWLSHIGPSDIFRKCASEAGKSGTSMFAKIQTACSHEIATVPYVPIPGSNYRKFRNMLDLGVSGVMLCWDFGFYPSMMTKAISELAFTPFPDNEEEFLNRLSELRWGRHAGKVAEAWKHFDKAYSFYPFSTVFAYYGPLHTAPVIPLMLKPEDKPLSPNWVVSKKQYCEKDENYPPSGDRIGECLTYTHTAKEAIILLEKMLKTWERGTKILDEIISGAPDIAEYLHREIGIAQALKIQIESSLDYFKFYEMREKLPFLPDKEKHDLLRRMKEIMEREIELSNLLISLCKMDSRLGFNAEACGYKYFIELLEWRIKQLGEVIENDFPEVEQEIKDHKLLFPAYTGQKPAGQMYECVKFSKAPEMNGIVTGKSWEQLEKAYCSNDILYSGFGKFAEVHDSCSTRRDTWWKAGYTDDHLYFGIYCRESSMDSIKAKFKDRQIKDMWLENLVEVCIEPKRLWPYYKLLANPKGARHQVKLTNQRNYQWQCSAWRGENYWSAILRIPIKLLQKEGFNGKTLRINAGRVKPCPELGHKALLSHWKEIRPAENRLVFGTDNPENLGWLLFQS